MNFNSNIIFAKLFSVLLSLTFVFAFSHRASAQTGQQVARDTLPSVVLVVGQKGKQKSITIGSGFWISSNTVVTNNHVIRGIKNLFIKPLGKKQLIKVKRVIVADSQKDLAVLEVGENVGRELKLSEKPVAIGEDIYVIGNPEGLEGTLSQGIISQLRKISGNQYLQITAPVSPGSSGGPVLNKNGEVVGVVVGSISKGQNLNFAISVSELKKVIVGKIIDIDWDELIDEMLSEDSNKISKWIEPDRSPKALEAINQAKKKLDSNPNNLNNVLALAKAYKNNRWYDDAIQLLQEESKKHPDSAEIYFDLGKVNYQAIRGFFFSNQRTEKLSVDIKKEVSKEYALKTKSSFLQAIKIKPDNYAYHFELCVFLVDVENVYWNSDEETITACSIASQIKSDPEAFYKLATAYERVKKIPEAIKAYKTALTLNPKHERTLRALAWIYRSQNDYKEALSYYQRSISIGIEEQNKYLPLGGVRECYIKSGNISSGITYFKGLIEQLKEKRFKDMDYPPVVDVYYSLGELYLEIGDKKSALEQYQLIKSLGEGSYSFRADNLFKRIYPQ